MAQASHRSQHLVRILLVGILFIMAVQGGDPKSIVVEALSTTPVRAIPSKVLIGYGIHCDHVRKAVHDGVNVVIWAFMDIVEIKDSVEECHGGVQSTTTRDLQSIKVNNGQRPSKIHTDLDFSEIRKLIKELDETGYSDVVHLVSCGGWNGPHLDPNLSATEWYDSWKASIASDIFHGVDWDLEGNDDLGSPCNVFSVDCLDKMGQISRNMKEDGYVVGMAPPQSYMNFDNPHFSRKVNLTEPERAWHPEFHYFGANVYSYLLAKYGDHIDFVSMQFYESYSLAAMAVYHNQMTKEDYLVSYIQDLLVQRQSKFHVEFSKDPDVGLESQFVAFPQSKLVIGLANGWAADSDNTKHFFISPEEVERAYKRLQGSEHGDLTPRGFMFWTIEEEGTNDVHLARDISRFLKNRNHRNSFQ